MKRMGHIQMAKGESSSVAGRDLRELSAGVPALEFEKKELSQRLQEIPFETQSLSLGDISIEKETEDLEQTLVGLKKI
jgi:uncharacterized protein (UPF0335 family)